MADLAFKIRGLDCAEEVALLKRAVGPVVGGAEYLAFDLMNSKMLVTEGAAEVTGGAIESAVSSVGLEAIPWAEAQSRQEGSWSRHGRTTLCAASGVFVLAGTVLWLGEQYGLFSGNASVGWRALFLSAIGTGGWYVFPKALTSIRLLRPDMHLLMSIAVVGALLIDEWFEAATVTFLFALALLLESWSVGRARRAIQSLMELAPATARYYCPHDGDIEEKPVEDVPVGVMAIVRPGEQVPLDGTVVKGTSSINEATITGESMPVTKEPGDEVYAGTINNQGSFEFRVTKPAGDTTLARIIQMVEEAQTRRAPSEQWVEKFARVYTPGMLLFALLTATVPPLVFGASWLDWFYNALVLLLIGCPCALVISTPVAIVAGLASAARAGVLVKGGVYLEAPARLRAVALDKTGTLTRGEPEVREVIPTDDHTAGQLLASAAALEMLSEHPLAKAIVRYAEGEQVAIPRAENFQASPGMGASAFVDGKQFWIGSHHYMHELEKPHSDEFHDKANRLQDSGHSVVMIGAEDHVCGLITIADAPRPEAAEAIKALKEAGIEHIVMLTGDNEGTARSIAAMMGVDSYRAELLPDEKAEAVRDLLTQWKYVAMVGEGVNDAPALQTATLGIAMGVAGADASIEAADVALMSDDLNKLAWLIRHSRRTLAIIKQNVALALGLKVVFVGLTFVGFATLWMAVAADTGASLLVTANALRMLRRNP